MDSGANSDGSVDEMSMPVRIRPNIRKAISHMEKYNKRRVTDKYWSGLFLVILTCWIASCQYVIRHETGYNILSDNSSNENNTTELVHLNNIPFENSVVTMNISEFLEEIDNETTANNGCPLKEKTERKSFSGIFSGFGRTLSDVFTFSLNHLDMNDEEYNIGPLMHLLFGLMFLALSFDFVYNNASFRKQPLVIGATFFFVALLEHISAVLYAYNSITFTLLSSHEKVASWMVPEAMFLILCIVRHFARVPSKEEDEHDDILFSDNYKFTIAMGVPVFAILHLLAFFTISLLQKVVWGSLLFYVIAGGSCYIGLAVYYYGAMVVSCAIRVSEDRKTYSLTNIFCALIIVARYHFGSACYHATLIIPRLRAISVMNDKKLKALSEYSTRKKFWMVHFGVYNSLTTFTGAIGANYANSLKELLRFWPNVVIKKDLHYYYRYFSMNLLITLLSINTIMILLLWMYDLDDPQFSLATRAMYAKIVFMFLLACSYLQATTDAHAFLAYRHWLRESAGDHLAETIFVRYFDEFDSSDDDTNSIDSGVYNESVF